MPATKILPKEGFPQPAWMTLWKLKKGNDNGIVDKSDNTFPLFVYISTHYVLFSYKKKRMLFF